MELARYHGICANCRFPFPNTMIDEIFRVFSPDLVEDSPFATKNHGLENHETSS